MEGLFETYRFDIDPHTLSLQLFSQLYFHLAVILSSTNFSNLLMRMSCGTMSKDLLESTYIFSITFIHKTSHPSKKRKHIRRMHCIQMMVKLGLAWLLFKKPTLSTRYHPFFLQVIDKMMAGVTFSHAIVMPATQLFPKQTKKNSFKLIQLKRLKIKLNSGIKRFPRYQNTQAKILRGSSI